MGLVMKRINIRKLFVFVMPVIVLSCASLNSSAAPATLTIRHTSIKWEDGNERFKLLATVPVWDESTLQTMFDVYRDGEHNQLPKTNKEKQYNIEFINGLWGPISNPFTKSPRPAKAFISFNNSSEFYMAPLIKDATDGNYYIFDKSQQHPMLLNDWVTNISLSRGGLPAVNFNICNGYGDALDDACMKEYTAEVNDAIGQNNTMSNRNLMTVVDHSSAQRDINQDWMIKANAPRLSNRAFAKSGSIFENSIDWKNNSAKSNLLNNTAIWPDFKTIQSNFEKIRDIRYFNDQRVTGFMRRISWLFPDDGCYTRASAVIKDLFGPIHNAASQYQRPSKIFAFGNLCVNTDNHPEGYVSWWYHTAPVVKDAATGVVYVLDPAVEPRKPLPVEQWMAAISANSGACSMRKNSVSKFNICNGYGATPDSKCMSNYSEEEYQDVAQLRFQRQERSRQEMLGRDVDKVLGDTPPWAN